MPGRSAGPIVLVTGASGHIGSKVCALLRAAGREVLAVDVHAHAQEGIEPCDVKSNDQIVQLFESHAIGTVIHLAAVLPTAFRADPIAAAEVNLTGTLSLLREAATHRVDRFVFGSSMSVYGSAHPSRALNERDLTVPDEPYGAAKRIVELLGENLAAARRLSFVSLRIARVVGPGARNTASSWRSQIFSTADSADQPAISIPFAPSARLSLVHVDEVARMLQLLAEAADLPRPIYNSPAEAWETQQLVQLVQRVSHVRVQMAEAQGGPLSDGTLFTQDFAFRLKGLADFLSTGRRLTSA